MTVINDNWISTVIEIKRYQQETPTYVQFSETFNIYRILGWR